MRTVSPDPIVNTGGRSIGYDPHVTVSGREGTKCSVDCPAGVAPRTPASSTVVTRQ